MKTHGKLLVRYTVHELLNAKCQHSNWNLNLYIYIYIYMLSTLVLFHMSSLRPQDRMKAQTKEYLMITDF